MADRESYPAKGSDGDAPGVRTARFLEKVRPLVASAGGVSAKNWPALAAIGRQMGLSDAQVKAALVSLQPGSGAASVERAPPPVIAPPAAAVPPMTMLPNKAPPAAPPAAVQEAAASTKTPPPLPGRRQRRAAPPSLGAAPVPEVHETPSLPPMAPLAADGTPPATGLPPAAAGVPPNEEEPEAPPPQRGGKSSSGRLPADRFRADLRKTLAAHVGKRLLPGALRRLVRAGERRHGLSGVYAEHLVEDVAAELGVRLAGGTGGTAVVPETFDPGETSGGGDAASAPAPQDQEKDPRLAEFARRAAPIIAQARGINAQSRVKLTAAARAAGLADAEMEAALRTLQASPAAEAADLRVSARREAFVNFLAAALARTRGELLTERHFEELIAAGRDRHGLAEAVAQQAVRQALKERPLRLVTRKQAREHVARLVREQLEAAGRLDRALRRRIHIEGQQWGLDLPEIDALVREGLEAAALVEQKAHWRGALVASVAAMVLAGIAIFLGWAAVMRAVPQPEPPPVAQRSALPGTPPPAGAELPAAAAEEAPPPLPRVAPWWDHTLTGDIVRAKVALPAVATALDQLRSPAAEERMRGYEALTRHARREQLRLRSESPEAASLLEGVLIGALALDPADETARRLAEQLLALAPRAGAPLTEDPRQIDLAYWAVRVVESAFVREGITSLRAELIAAALGDAVGERIDPAADPAELDRLCMAALSRHLYRALTAAAAEQPYLVQPLHEALSPRAFRYLPRPVFERLETEFLAAALRGIGDGWRSYEYLILRCVQSSDVANALRLLEVYEEGVGPELAALLGRELALRVGVPWDAAAPPAELSAAIRRKLGAEAAPVLQTAAERRQLLRRLADEAAAAAPDAAGDPAALLGHAVLLQRLATMGCALGQKELGFAAFDELRDARDLPPPAETPPSAPRTGAPAALPDHVDRLMRQMVQSLAGHRRMQTAQRVALFQRIAQTAAAYRGRGYQLGLEQGRTIASYLFAAKPIGEHEAVMAVIDAVADQNAVVLGAADEIADTRLRPEHAEELLARLLGRSVTLDAAPSGREALRRALIERAIQRLGFGMPRGESADPLYAAAAELYLERYRVQARLLGVAPAQYFAAKEPGDVLLLLVEQLAARPSGAPRRREDQQLLDTLPHSLAAIAYLARDDVRRTAMLETLYLRLLAADLAGRMPGRAAELYRLADAAGERPPAHLLAQLGKNQQRLLELWLAATQ